MAGLDTDVVFRGHKFLTEKAIIPETISKECFPLLYSVRFYYRPMDWLPVFHSKKISSKDQ
jgi:hypothetical protein